MHETTQISYGLGTVDIILNSESSTGISDPHFRFTDYDQVLCSCFTPKELEQISEGEHAGITFNLVLTDAPDSELESSLFRFEEISGKFYADLEEGLFINLEAYKTLGDSEPRKLEMFSEKTEFRLNIPDNLKENDREYFLYTTSLGGSELYEDTDRDADTISINAGTIGNSILLYREISFMSSSAKQPLAILNPQYICVVGIVLLLLLWKRIDFLHKKE
ncbi:MAG: hypothetical protein J5802_05610 [Butyrivibrio sp.]|nr:hypothetical protein [Butyrivibrio sp.]